MVLKRAFPVLKSTSASKGLEGSEELHLKMQQTVDEIKVMPKRECPALKSPPAGTRLDKSGELHPVMQQTAVKGFSHAGCTRSTYQGGNLYFQANVGMIPESITPQMTARQVARLLMSQQQQGMIAWSDEQNKQFDPGRCFCRGDGRFVFCILCYHYFLLLSFCYFSLLFSVAAGERYCRDRGDKKRIFTEEDDGHANAIDEEHCLEINHLFTHHPREDRHLNLII